TSPVTEIYTLSLHDALPILQGEAAIGHVRYGTAGTNTMKNTQPFLFEFHDEQLALANNGNLTNAITLRKELEENGAIFSSNSDTDRKSTRLNSSHVKISYAV